MTKKGISIDIWRFAASFLVAAIHISPFEKINGELDFFFTAVAGRIAVPLFLMITGYYILDKARENKKALVSYTVKILKLYLFCIFLYLPVNVYMGLGAASGAEAEPKAMIMSVLKDIFINGSFYHLWYFPALVFGLWAVYFLIKSAGERTGFVTVCVLYAIGLFGDGYYGFIKDSGTIKGFYEAIFAVSDYTRNGLFYAPVFLYLGYSIKRSGKGGRHDFMYAFLLFILMSAEGTLLHRSDMQRHTAMYLFLVPLMYFLFRALIFRSGSENKKLRNLASEVYVLHPLMIVAVRFFAKLTGTEIISVENNLLLYIIVCLLSAGAGLLWEFLRQLSGKATLSRKPPSP